jgi:hypothetical protein
MSMVVFVVMIISTISIVLSFFVQRPFEEPERGVFFTGFKAKTLMENLWPQYDSEWLEGGGAASGFSHTFAILFNACSGVLSSADLSDVRNPGQVVTKGTFSAMAFTFLLYVSLVLLISSTVQRATLYAVMTFLQDINMAPTLFSLGVFVISLFAAVDCFLCSCQLLTPMAIDDLHPAFRYFRPHRSRCLLLLPDSGSNGEEHLSRPPRGDGWRAIWDDVSLSNVLVAWVLTQVLILIGDLNAILPFVSMTSVLLYAALNVACTALALSGTPNFRPSFRYFRWWTALLGVALCIGVMYVIQAWVATVLVVLTIAALGFFHLNARPKPWGDITQCLIYHQVRKYLLRLDIRKEHVKYWRPQVSREIGLTIYGDSSN